MNKRYFASESVTEGHPDKVCDLIADSILDACLEQDSASRVACEVCCSTGFVLVTGEITTKAIIDIPQIVRKTIKKIGYTSSEMGFDADTCAVFVNLDKQSEDIALGVNNSLEIKDNDRDELNKIGAGDQGMVFGYACDETDDYMPLAISLAHSLTKQLTKVRKTGELSYLRPDGKSQVCVEYIDGEASRIDSIVLSSQHDEDVSIEEMRRDLINLVINEVIPKSFIDTNTKILINPTGRFVIGGPHGDSGVTGRKIVADSYGGYCANGGGAFSGKDPTKIDRSAAYMARYICKNIVASGLAKTCQIMIAYAIGQANPLILQIDTYGTNTIPEDDIKKIINQVFDLRPSAIINNLALDKPIYTDTTNYGHFGGNAMKWENLDKIEEIKHALGLINEK